jgi:sorbitol-specific phosphotransferase system component IIBC
MIAAITPSITAGVTATSEINIIELKSIEAVDGFVKVRVERLRNLVHCVTQIIECIAKIEIKVEIPNIEIEIVVKLFDLRFKSAELYVSGSRVNVNVNTNSH